MYGLFHRAGKAAVALPHVHFQPWVGSGYERGIAGRKVLVLGESHYCARQEDDVPEVTVNVIRDLLDPESEFEAYKNTYTKFERALTGTELDWTGKARLWNSVVFYNYVQTPLSGPRRAPSAEPLIGDGVLRGTGAFPPGLRAGLGPPALQRPASGRCAG